MTRTLGGRARARAAGLALLAASLGGLGVEVRAQEACATPVGKVVAPEGRVALRRGGKVILDTVPRQGAPLCAGDTVVTETRGRAALSVQPETHIRIDQNTQISVTARGGDVDVDLSRARAGVDAKPGGAYFMTRFPKRFKVRTRFVNATVEGTEFAVRLTANDAEISVLEGRVLAEEAGTSGRTRRIAAGEAATSGSNVIRKLVSLSDRVQWALHYPRLSPDDTSGGCASPSESRLCRIAAIEQRLTAGRADEAAGLFGPVTTTDADLLALQSIAATAQSDRESARALARLAVAADGQSLRAQLALSYAAQADADLPAALEAARAAHASGAAPAFTGARMAELLLASGDVRAAREAADAALSADPRSVLARNVRGFCALADRDPRGADEDFAAAVALAPAEPTTHLGRGLAAIRQGRLAEGREHIAVAVSLDPGNALLRAYLGKAFFDERTRARDALAGEQFELARRLDGNDPTPWFYDAIRKQVGNRPGEALADLEEARTRNARRAVVRARGLLDLDQAARGASQARVYHDLGFDQLALSTAAGALTTDPDNFGAHRFLAEAYAARPRSEAARVSELLQSQLRQPVNATPLLTQETEANLLVPFTGGPLAVSGHEFNPLFMRDRATLSLSAFGGDRDTRGAEVSAGWLQGGTALAAGAYRLDTDGFRPGADLRQEIARVFVQHDLSAGTSLQAEARAARLEHGDIKLRFDPSTAPVAYRRTLDTNTLRLGARHAFSADTDVITSFILQRREEEVLDRAIDSTDPTFPVEVALRQRLATDAGTAETQWSRRWEGVSVRAGAGLYLDRTVDRGTLDVTDVTFQIPLVNEVTDGRPRVQHRNVYLYSLVPVGERVRIAAGLTAEHFERHGLFERNRVHPKLGAVYEPADGTVLRAVALRGMKRPLPGSQTLEPTEVAGFNQFFDDANGTTFTRFGLGIDQRFGTTLFAGAELSTRSLSTPETVASATTFNPWRERLHRAYVGWLPAPALSLGVEHYVDRQSRDVPPGRTDATFIRSLDSRFTPVTATWHAPSGFFVRLRATHVRQEAAFPLAAGGSTGGTEAFWLADAQFGYRLAPGRAALTVQVFNLLDRSFRFQNTELAGDPRPPLFTPGRSLMLRLSCAL